MKPTRKTAIIAGTCYLVTHVTSVAALVLYGPALNRPGFVTGTGSTTSVLAGGWLEVVLAIAVVGTAVALFPVVRQFNEGLAIGYVALRTLEAAVIAAGIVSLLAVVTLRQHPGGADAGAITAVSKGLVAAHNWTFLIGPDFICAADTFVLACLMWRSRLIPRIVAGLGLVGGPLLFVSATAILFGAYKQVSVLGSIAPLPVFAWELGLALFLIIRGFRIADTGQDAAPRQSPAVPVLT